ncbi:hypothetical protein [Paenibacillus nasutitermitis]|uniref:DUF3918 domain-containing protein n=1 Tax=Paenibacillus nasutitermitis TaxID=1652958 RepID=A0A916YXJ1_9BACL|nr:hypothetical protein [Paenibacillus nasutitermitis]GGD66073.1 hypothetical protein GCM10010911_24760 [Paenibacillus nasutitermitis]
MKKMLMTAAGLGIAYLMRNKSARDKLINKVQSFTNKSKHPQI